MSRWQSPEERRAIRRRREMIGAALLLGYLALWFIDRPVFVHFQYASGTGEGKWGQMFKAFGFLPLWVLACAAIGLGAVERRGRLRGWLVLLSAALSGLLAELLKRIVGRERPWTPEDGPAPDPGDLGALAGLGGEAAAAVHVLGDKIHKPFLYGFVDNHRLGFPSSHTAVAFGAALLALRFWPGAWPALLAIAGSCAWQRLAAGDHFVTDVYGGVAIAWIVSAWIAGRAEEHWR
jgi:membrane-associated phospholipid phosphatase